MDCALAQELLRKEMFIVNREQTCRVLFTVRTETRAEARYLLTDLDSQAGFTALEHDWLCAIQLRTQEHWVLHLHQGAEFAIEIFYDIFALACSFDGRMASAYRYVVSNADIGLLGTSNFYVVFVFSVDYVKDLLRDRC